MSITPREGVLTLSSGPLTYTVPFTDGEIEIDAPARTGDGAMVPLSGSVAFSFSAFTAHDGAQCLVDVIRRASWATQATAAAAPVRVQAGRYWCIAQATGAVYGLTTASVNMRRLTPWRRVYGRGEARPRRNTVVRTRT